MKKKKTARRRLTTLVQSADILRKDRLAEMLRDRLVSRHEAFGRVIEIIDAVRIRGMQPIGPDDRRNPGPSLWLRFERAWAVDAVLTIQMVIDPAQEARHSSGWWIDVYTPKISLNWSASERTIPQALAAQALYREVIELAAALDAALQSRPIGLMNDDEEEDA